MVGRLLWRNRENIACFSVGLSCTLTYVHLQRLSPLGHEERRQLVDLLVVLDDWRESLYRCVFAERPEVLSQEVLWHEAGAELVVQDRFQARGHGVDVLRQDLHLDELLHVRDIVQD